MKESEKEYHLNKLRFSQFLYKKYGKPALMDIEEFEIKRMVEIFNELGEQNGRSLRKLMEVLWENMGPDFEYSVVRENREELEIRCTKCPLVELSIENGMEEIGYSTYCMSDYGIAKGFNKDIKFKRTKTLMEGHDCCNHSYILNK